MVQRRAPQLKAETPPAIFRLDDIEPEEPEIRPVADGGDAADRDAAKVANEEPLRVGRLETSRVMKARIPAFRRRPAESEPKIGFAHAAHHETVVAHGLGSRGPQTKLDAVT